MKYFTYLIIAVALGVAVYLLNKLLLWMESRGWIYYRRHAPSSSSLGAAALEVQTLVDPSKRHVIEAKQSQKKEQDDSGDPPKPGEMDS